MNKSRGVLPRRMAWTLIVIAIVFWLWFGIGSAYVEKGGAFNWLMHILVPGGVFILSALAAWRWERIGGGLLLLEGIVALGFIVRAFLLGRLTASSMMLMCLTLALPPLTAGTLLLLGWQQSQGHQTSEGRE